MEYPGSLAILALALCALAVVWLSVWLRARRIRTRAAARPMPPRHDPESLLLDRLSAGLAHELKNPLGALSLNIQLLEEELDASASLSESARARFATITRECRSLQNVLDDFLRYASRRELSLGDVDLNLVVADLVTFIKPDFHRRRVLLLSTPSGRPLMVKADFNLIKQAILNVILNALEATPAGGSVEVSTRQAPPEAIISVRDTGVGIAPEDVTRIFDVYFSRKKDGIGLGLAIANRIIEDHDGHISVKSTPGRGTEISVALPVAGPSIRPGHEMGA